MKRIRFFLACGLTLFGCGTPVENPDSTESSRVGMAVTEAIPNPPIALESEEQPMNFKVVKTTEEWKSQLSPEQFHVTREKGTERAFSGAYHADKIPGIYKCICCGEPLFDSKTKFDSGTGWPSFYQPISDEAILNVEDRSHFMVRTETICKQCGAHLGHVFPDGPEPTGKRYCINSVSLILEEKKE